MTIASQTPHPPASCFACFDLRDLELAESTVDYLKNCPYCGIDAPNSHHHKFMQCRSCSFEFCTICGGAWVPERGCTSKICILRRLWHAAFWGDDSATRYVTRSLAVPFILIGLCMAAGAVVAAVGLGIVALAVGLGLAAVALPLIAIGKYAVGAFKGQKERQLPVVTSEDIEGQQQQHT
jgi:hypothetical protein